MSFVISNGSRNSDLVMKTLKIILKERTFWHKYSIRISVETNLQTTVQEISEDMTISSSLIILKPLRKKEN